MNAIHTLCVSRRTHTNVVASNVAPLVHYPSTVSLSLSLALSLALSLSLALALSLAHLFLLLPLPLSRHLPLPCPPFSRLPSSLSVCPSHSRFLVPFLFTCCPSPFLTPTPFINIPSPLHTHPASLDSDSPASSIPIPTSLASSIGPSSKHTSILFVAFAKHGRGNCASMPAWYLISPSPHAANDPHARFHTRAQFVGARYQPPATIVMMEVLGVFTGILEFPFCFT